MVGLRRVGSVNSYSYHTPVARESEARFSQASALARLLSCKVSEKARLGGTRPAQRAGNRFFPKESGRVRQITSYLQSIVPSFLLVWWHGDGGGEADDPGEDVADEATAEGGAAGGTRRRSSTPPALCSPLPQ